MYLSFYDDLHTPGLILKHEGFPTTEITNPIKEKDTEKDIMRLQEPIRPTHAAPEILSLIIYLPPIHESSEPSSDAYI